MHVPQEDQKAICTVLHSDYYSYFECGTENMRFEKKLEMKHYSIT